MKMTESVAVAVKSPGEEHARGRPAQLGLLGPISSLAIVLYDPRESCNHVGDNSSFISSYKGQMIPRALLMLTSLRYMKPQMPW